MREKNYVKKKIIAHFKKISIFPKICLFYIKIATLVQN